jgi:uncharacterized protein
MHLEPMSFAEFVSAVDGADLRELLDSYPLDRAIALPLHERLKCLFREYVLVGGMPAVVDRYREARSFSECAVLQQDLLSTYRDDFGKYASRSHHQRLQKVLHSVPRQLGQKFTYAKVDREERSAVLRNAVELLGLARICHRILATDATGIPLGAESDERRFKMILLDVGLTAASLNLDMGLLDKGDDLCLVNEGGLAEQVVGQALRTLAPAGQEPQLYYWVREQTGAGSELDYIVQHGARMVPIEVKSGASGSLRSLHLFMSLRKLPQAVRFNSERFSVTEVDVLVRDGKRVRYQLVSLPMYMAGNLNNVLSRLPSPS